jgi:hypothetical protein
MTLWFRNFRISILNWLAAGRITIEKNKPKDYNMAYTIGGSGGTVNLGPASGYSSGIKTNQTMVIKITPANGGTIIQMNTEEYGQGELHIIPDDSDFDRELGKIITLSKLKS